MNMTQMQKMADTLDKHIKDKRRPMTQNPTPKRMKEYNSRLHDADNLERTQQALRAMAKAVNNGGLPTILASIKNKQDASRLVHKGLEPSGYYDVIPSSAYRDTSEAGKVLQEMIEQSETTESKDEKAQRELAQNIKRAEEKFRFLKIKGFFPTPKIIIEIMIDRADIANGMAILEPSAGKGDIAESLTEKDHKPKVIEIRPALQEILSLKGFEVVGDDFLEHTDKYDRIIMNPPFEGGQDIEHVRHAYNLLKPGGKVISIMSEGIFFNSRKRFQEFRDWLDSVGGESEKLDSAFKGLDSFRQTGVATRIVEINKTTEELDFSKKTLFD